MKPPKFQYFAPSSLSEAAHLLHQHGGDAKVLAGGQSLMPLLSMRLVRPQVVVDVNRVSELQYISPAPGGGLAVGALTRQRELERSALVSQTAPLLAAALPFIGHLPTRNRGTVGGSMVHADPAAELPAVGVTLQAEFVLASEHSRRVVPAADFFLDYLTTALEPDELLTEVRWPALDGRWGWGIQEVCRREGDFALVGAAALLQFDDGDRCLNARITMFGVGGKPLRMERAEQALAGAQIGSQGCSQSGDGAVADAARLVSEDLTPQSDVHASSQYRKEVAGVLARRTLLEALARAQETALP